MSGLIKQGARATVVAGLPPARSLPSGSATVVDPRIAELEAELARLEATLAAERVAARQAVEQARRDGRADATAEDERRTGLIADGVAQARRTWDRQLAELDVLAAKLARGALAKIFGDADDLATLVERTIAHHLELLADQAWIGVRVSARDFSSEAVDALAAQLDLPRTRLEVDPDLRAGACRIDLRLGAIDLDPVRQWTILDQALLAMEQGR